MYASSIVGIVIFVLLLGVLLFAQVKKVSFNVRALSSLVIGLGFGLILRTTVTDGAAHLSDLVAILDFSGSIYVKLLMMLIIPLVFTAIVHSIVNLRGKKGSYLTKVAFKTVAILLLTTGVSAIIGSYVAQFFDIGHGLSIPGVVLDPSHSSAGILTTLLAMIPSNPVEAMANNNVIAVVIFAVLIGVATLQLHKQEEKIAEPFIGFIHSAFFVSKKLANMVISLTPYGVMALMTHMSLTQGWTTLHQMITFVGAMYIAMVIVLCMHIVLLLLVGVNPITYFKNVYRALLVAFTTRSSFGTMPVTMDALGNRMKLSESVSNFVPGVGATIGMNACAGVYPAMLVVMTMTILGMPITWETVLFIAFINMIASLGVSGIPGTAFVAAGVTLSTMGLPYSIVALVQGVDPIIDMGRTAVNVNAVMTTAVIVDKTTSVD